MAKKSRDNAGAKSAGKVGKADCQERLSALELERNDLARWLQHTGRRLVVLVEGRDTAGKGGVISAMAGSLNPRTTRSVALPKPTERERTQVRSPTTS